MNLKVINKVNPPSKVGIVGGGQLGRMLAIEAKRMGYGVVILDPKENSPAGQVSDEQIIGDFSDINSLRELSEKTDVITYEFEHIDVDALRVIEKEGKKIYPCANTLKMIQNKFVQKSILNDAGVKVPKFYKVNNIEELKEIFYNLNEKMVLKSCTGGYDGKGNIIIKNINELEDAYLEFANDEIMAEEFVNYIKEVSIIVGRNSDGVVFYPIAENTHKNSILINSIIPAKITSKTENEIRIIAEKIINEIDDFGVFCIEFFIDSNLNVLVNEIAPRPHNSGHYTIEGCITSQYEQVIRIITGMPLGSTKLVSECSMYNVLGNEEVEGKYKILGLESILNIENCHFHLYGKAESKYLKKIGHITALGESIDIAKEKAKEALDNIKIVPLEIVRN